MVFSTLLVFGQAKKFVFLEEFTQASCGPCETTTPLINQFVENNIDKIVQLRYQTSWPGVDPMNEDNPEEVQTRVDYYGVEGVPDIKVDGQEHSGGNATTYDELFAAIQSDFDGYAAETPAIGMSLSHSFSDDLTTMDVQLKINNVSTEAYSVSTNKLRVAIVEEEISWEFKPGSTSIQVFEAVLKKFIAGSAAGVSIDEIAAGDSLTLNYSVDVPSTYYNFKELAVVAFVQDDSNKKVVNAIYSEPITVTGISDLALEKIYQQNDSYCNNIATTSVIVKNTGDVAIAAFDLNLVANGQIIKTENWTGDLQSGSSETFEYEVTLPFGATSLIEYNVNITGTERDYNINNQRSLGGVYSVFSENALEGLDVDFEANAIADQSPFIVLSSYGSAFVNIDKSISTQIPSKLGAYAESDKSIWVDFYNWNAGGVATMSVGEIDFTDKENYYFSFDRAYAQYQNEDDKLELLASTDCGISWDVLWSKSGSSLKTHAPVNPSRFWPGANDWKTDSINLQQYDGMDKVSFQFKATSGYGNCLFIDNPSLKQGHNVAVEDIYEGGFSIYPNPVNNQLFISLDNAINQDYKVEVRDIQGRIVLEQNYSSNGATNVININTESLNEGMYILDFQTEKGSFVSKFSKL